MCGPLGMWPGFEERFAMPQSMPTRTGRWAATTTCGPSSTCWWSLQWASCPGGRSRTRNR
uniref:Alternative protein TTBK1 n=1 Tax=Homo sapiens TaxID=9606 RepID=L8E9F5_HUMAN|nr:alternative protein TTBK1 [Homo sapiens]